MNRLIYLSSVFLIQDLLALDLNSYLRDAIQQSEEIQIAQNEYQLADNSLTKSRSLYKTNMNFSFFRQERDYHFPGSIDYQLDSNIADVSISQSTPIGMTIEGQGQLDYSKHSEYEDDQSNYQYSLGISLPIYRNAFGSQFRKKIEEQTWLKEGARLTLSATRAEQCLSEINLFLDGYLAQERLAVAHQVEKNSFEIWSLVQKLYEQKMINELNYLSAKSDYIDQKMLKDQFMSEWNGMMEKLHLTQKDTILSDPFSAIEEMELQPLDYSQVVYLKKNEADLHSLESAKRVLIDQSRSEVNLVAKAAKSVTKNDYSFSVAGDNDNYYVMVGVSINYPLYDPQSNLQLIDVVKKKNIAELEKQRKESEIMVNLKVAEKQYQANQIKYDKMLDKTTILTRRVKLAFESFKKGKFELDEYLRFRDSLEEQRVQLLELKKSIVDYKLMHMQMNGQILNWCGN